MRWLNWLFPSGLCSFCRRPVRPGPPWACTACVDRLPRLQPPFCRYCSRPLRSTSPAKEGHAWVCRFCRVRPPFGWAVYVGTYEAALQVHIQRLKFENHRVIAQALGHLLALRVRPMLDRTVPTVVVPIPLHARRLWTRGFNQAALLAQAVSDHCGVPMKQPLRRRRDTLPQTGLSLRERQRNLQGAFEVVEPVAVAGRHVVLVDDVYTTGTTCREAAFALLRSGARSVGVACVAVRVAHADMIV